MSCWIAKRLCGSMWIQVKRIFRPGLPGFFGERTPARQLSPEPEGGGLSETENADSLGSSTQPSLHGPLPRTSQSLFPNQVVDGHFEILRFLNSEGRGEVYEAWDRDLRERIALKTIRPEIKGRYQYSVGFLFPVNLALPYNFLQSFATP